MADATDVPVTRYAETERGAIAYQVVGEGPVTILANKGPVLPVDMMWEEPSLARYVTGWRRSAGASGSILLVRVPPMRQKRSRIGSLRELSPTW